jgi:hypothetical protein
MILKRLALLSSSFVFSPPVTFLPIRFADFTVSLRSFLPFVMFFVLAITAAAQQSSTILTQVINALAGENLVRSASLTGTVTSPNVSVSISAPINFNAISQQWSEVDVEWATGKQTEIRNGGGIFPSRSWIGSDGIAHKAAPTDLKLPHPAWFFPTFVLLSGLGSPNYWASDLGTQTWQGKTVHHIAVWQRSPSDLPATSTLQQQTQADFYLDPTTFLPVSMTFNVQIDPNLPSELVVPSTTTTGTILVEVDFSDYRSVQGAQVPYQLNVSNGSTQILNIQISSVTINGNGATSASN